MQMHRAFFSRTTDPKKFEFTMQLPHKVQILSLKSGERWGHNFTSKYQGNILTSLRFKNRCVRKVSISMTNFWHNANSNLMRNDAVSIFFLQVTLHIKKTFGHSLIHSWFTKHRWGDIVPLYTLVLICMILI
jgi:hypothetical protein